MTYFLTTCKINKIQVTALLAAGANISLMNCDDENRVRSRRFGVHLFEEGIDMSILHHLKASPVQLTCARYHSTPRSRLHNIEDFHLRPDIYIRQPLDVNPSVLLLVDR
jgi:hypothetical protein